MGTPVELWAFHLKLSYFPELRLVRWFPPVRLARENWLCSAELPMNLLLL